MAFLKMASHMERNVGRKPRKPPYRIISISFPVWGVVWGLIGLLAATSGFGQPPLQYPNGPSPVALPAFPPAAPPASFASGQTSPGTIFAPPVVNQAPLTAAVSPIVPNTTSFADQVRPGWDIRTVVPQPLEGAQIIARVGPEIILAGEALPLIRRVEEQLQKIREQYGSEVSEEDVAKLRANWMKQVLEQLIQTKLVYADARENIPAESFPDVEKELAAAFQERELPRLMEVAEAKTRIELDRILRQEGSSLERRKKAFIERALAIQWARESSRGEVEITPLEMQQYYQDHLDDYSFPSRARWEQIVVQVKNHSSKEAAYQRLALLGRQLQQGAPFAEVARQHSEGYTAKEGGQRDWTTKGSLVSGVLDQALFGLPVGQLSPILEDGDTFQIIRVLERQWAGRKPFEEVQPEIRKTLEDERRKEQEVEYFASLRKQFPVWTIYDAALDTAEEAPSDALANRPR